MIDSGCSPTKELIEKFNLELIGIKIVMDRKVYVDGVDIDHNLFYLKVPKTRKFKAEPPVYIEVLKRFRELKSKGAAELVVINFSSKMTKLVETCKNASTKVPGLKINIVDTENWSVGAYFIAEKAVELLHDGMPFRDVMKLLPEIKKSSFMQFSVPTLKHAAGNGRTGKAGELVGKLLNKKPILGVDKGGISLISTVTGRGKALATMVGNAANFIDRRPHNVKLYVTWGTDRDRKYVQRALYEIMDRFEKLGIEPDRIIEGRVSPTIACGSGPEVFEIGVYGEKHPIQ